MIVLDAIYMVILTIIRVCMPIVLLFAILIGLKILYRYKKYGYVEFDVFRKREKTKFSDIIFFMLDKIEVYKKIIKINQLYADMIVISETGVYLLKLTKYQGYVIGNRDDLKLTNKVKMDIISQVDNPFYYLDQDKTRILKKNANLIIETILVTNNISQININHVSKEEIILLKDFYFQMENKLKSKKIYSKDKISEIVKMIEMI